MIKEGPMPITYLMAAIVTTAALVATPMLSVFLKASQDSTAVAARDRNVRLMLDLFKAIEERDLNHRNVERELSFYQPDVEFHWPAALPYGGTFRGLAGRSGRDWG